MLDRLHYAAWWFGHGGEIEAFFNYVAWYQIHSGE
jgi:hypothetical protein